MSFSYRRRYTGPVRAVILDWAGTTVDHGSLAPLAAFQGVFASEGVEVTEAEARAPMGMEKWAHIEAMAKTARIGARWEEVHGAPWTNADIDRMFARFMPVMERAALERAQVIEGVPAAIQALRERGVAIGSTTGYPRGVLEPLVRLAAEQGYAPACAIAGDDVSPGRPAPWALLEAARRLGVWPIHALVKVDDSPVGIEAGLNAGCWTVGITTTGNLMGLDQGALDALPEADRRARADAARTTMLRIGAHYTVSGVAELLPVIDDIDARLRRGEAP